MSSTVLFNSSRPLGRCENITAVWDAYDGPKTFVQGGFANLSARCERVIVTDEFLQGKSSYQVAVMIGHGLTGGKLYGEDQKRSVYIERGVCELVDWFVTSSEHGIPFAASSAHIPEDRCLPLGMPRTDAYFGVRKGDGGTPMAKFKRAYLYAPTFRSCNDDPAPLPDWSAIDEMMDDDELLVVKRHMVVRSPILGDARYTHIIEVGNDEPSAPYLIDCDVLVTDYSTILFDAQILDKPSVLVCDDMDSFLSTRGMYMRYPEQYGSRWTRVRGNERGLLEEIRDASHTGMREADLECLRMVADACDGHSAQRVVELVKSLL